ncbi:hypothetical protein PACTADRAFT_50646 [Pachysolen tannophilus NRRL Y-2460]|uniref:RING-CH-type domain-containing protein n=1 Tax=Pachysolen tannophilus NRRL Y-2460 TaxID=669874 RepID=A0A1E4TSS0_PACTA|nr:hypothetical protein PACTADRAFT_50646 [Pachysolen tannophilus NRRL Y-2460]
MSSSSELHDSNDHCWICLGSKDEIPPMGKPKDAHDWVKPCSCSLTAHRICFINWVLSIDLEKKRAERIQEGANNNNNNNNNTVQDFSLWGRIGIHIETSSNPLSPRGIGSVSNDRSRTTISVKCPQCSRLIFLKTEKEPINSLRMSIQEFIIFGTKFVSISTLVSTAITATVASVAASFSAAGVHILSTLCPESVQMRLLNIPASNLLDALDRNLIPARFFAITGGLPIYLLNFRVSPFKTSNLQEFYVQSFPLLCMDRINNMMVPRARAGLLILNLSRFAYNIFFSLTFNRIYYRWVRTVQPSSIADRLSLEELDQIQAENKEEYELQLEHDLLKQKKGYHSSKSFFTKIYDFIFKNDSMRKIKRSRSRREIENCIKHDYSGVFEKKSVYLTIFTTMLWPKLGEIVASKLLRHIPLLTKFINKYAQTPDEGTFIRNIIGCCCVVLLKDLFNLFLTWRKVRQLSKIRIVEYGSKEWEESASVKMVVDSILDAESNADI